MSKFSHHKGLVWVKVITTCNPSLAILHEYVNSVTTAGSIYSASCATVALGSADGYVHSHTEVDTCARKIILPQDVLLLRPGVLKDRQFVRSTV